MRRRLVYGLVGLMGCMALTGCSAAEQGEEQPDKIIIELKEAETEEESSEESTTESESEAETEEESSAERESKSEEESSEAQSDIYFSVSTISEEDEMVALMAAQFVGLEDVEGFSITDVTVIQDGKRAKDIGQVEFSAPAEDGDTVVLYSYEDGKLVETVLEVKDGQVSYTSEDCSRWLILDADYSEEPESESESATAEE